MQTKKYHSHLLYISLIVTDVRWYYGTIAFLFGVVDGDGALGSVFVEPIFVIFALYLLANFFIYLVLEDIVRKRYSIEALPAVNALQVSLDIIYVTLIIGLSNSEFPGIGQILYFIPIITSTIFFGVLGAFSVALAAGAATFFLMLRALGFGVLGGGGITNPSLIYPMTQATIITGMYVLASFFGETVSRSIRVRDQLLTEKIHREEDHIKRLSTLAKEFDASAKLLVRRDLDLTKANRELELLDRMKSEIISVVAHQLRTPLSAVKWTLKMLTDGDAGKTTTEQKTYMMKAYESNERMIALVNDMLSADRLESGKFRYRFFPIQLEDLIENIVTEMLPKANERGVMIRFVRPETALPRVVIDPDKIRDVLQNLIDNALKYSRRGGTVTIGLITEGDESIRCSIIDQGIGIPAGEKEKIFSRFFRAQNALRVETDGSGLGLFIVRGIIQRHGGTIWFDSEEGKGTSMHVRLPIDPGNSARG